VKAFVVNSSPHMDKGNTGFFLAPFLEGMREAAAEVETVYPRKMKIMPCEGCYDCWVKTPGVCRHKDDMPAVLKKLAQADIWVMATPVYVDGMTGTMKMFLDRIIPMAQPFFEMRDGHNRHPGREGAKRGGSIALVSTCGFWELDNFDPLVLHIKAWCKNAAKEFAGALLRPHAGSLQTIVNMGGAKDVMTAAREAGRQIAQSGRISPEAQRAVSRELVPMQAYFDAANRGFKQSLEHNTGKQAA